MARRKKLSTIKSTSGFSNPTNLTLEELSQITITSTEDISTTLLPNINWNEGAIGTLCLSLSSDNQNVAAGNLVLLGSLFNSKTFNAGNFWTCSQPTSLTLSLPNLSIFTFPDGSLTSDYAPSSDFNYSFSQNNSTLQPTDLIASNITDFCLRAFVYPTSDSFARILILLYPSAEDSLATFPLYLDPRFPGIKLCDYEFPLAPAGPCSPLGRYWGFTLVPAVLPGSTWSPLSPLPTGLCLRSALTSILRSAVLPDSSTLAGFKKKLDDLHASGSFSSPSKTPQLLWPTLCTPDAPSNRSLGNNSLSFFLLLLLLFFFKEFSLF